MTWLGLSGAWLLVVLLFWIAFWVAAFCWLISTMASFRRLSLGQLRAAEALLVIASRMPGGRPPTPAQSPPVVFSSDNGEAPLVEPKWFRLVAGVVLGVSLLFLATVVLMVIFF